MNKARGRSIDEHPVWKTLAEAAFARSRDMTRDAWLVHYEAVEEVVDGKEAFVEKERK